MLSKIRVTLLILLVGFILEGSLEAFNYVNHSYPLPFASSVLVVGPFITLIGMITLWIGRRDWDQPLRPLFRLAQRAFVIDVLALFLIIIPVVWYGRQQGLSIPSWANWEFGTAIVTWLVFNFVIYVLVAFELTNYLGKTMLLIAFGWGVVVSILIGIALGNDLGKFVEMVQTRSVDPRPIFTSISGIESLTAVAYFLLTIAYLDAYHRSRRKPMVPASESGSMPTTQSDGGA